MARKSEQRRSPLRWAFLCFGPLALLLIFCVAPEDARPDGLGWVLGVAAGLSGTAVAADCAGFIGARCPLASVCFLLFLTQFGLVMQVKLTSMHGNAARPVAGVERPGRQAESPPDVTMAAVAAVDVEKHPEVPAGEVAAVVASMASAASLPVLPEVPRFSVVLACAEEGEYAWKTALNVADRTPPEVLEEVLVVDDGSRTTMERVFTGAGWDAAKRAEKKIKILRHDTTLGLMIAKKTGGDAAKGDIIVFLDCHCSAQPNWHVEISSLIKANPLRMVVPAITDLDIDTWEEKKNSAVNTKCYLTWDADFNWFDDESPDVPVMSGGLLALSNHWWQKTGGYDDAMRGWGGENLDQSLRSWLCGGEIVRAPSSRVAHMWRTGEARTAAKYSHTGNPSVNRGRVVAAWYDEFKVKYQGGNQLRYDVSKITKMQKEQNCKPFVHFLHRFRDVYIEGAVIPSRVFQLRDKASGKCLSEGYSQALELQACGEKLPSQSPTTTARTWWHWANRAKKKEAGQNVRCCSGLRRWASNMCLDYADGGGSVHTYLCDVTGQNGNQQWRFQRDLGQILHGNGQSLVVEGTKVLQRQRNLQQVWEEIDEFEPVEATLYREGIKREGLSDPAFPDGLLA